MSQQWRFRIELVIRDDSAVVVNSATTKRFLAVRVMGNVQDLHVASAFRKTLLLEARR